MATVVDLVKDTVSDVNNGATYSYDYYNQNATSTVADVAYTTYTDIADFVTKNVTHSKDDFIAITSLKRIYRCALDGTVGKVPPSNPSIWTDYGAVNSFALFDNTIVSQTESDSDFTVTFDFNRINTIALLNMEGITSVTITQTNNADASTTVQTVSLRDYGALSLYDYWYKPTSDIRNYKKIDMKWLPSSSIQLDFTVAGVGKIGSVVSGYNEELGLTLYGTTVGFDDNSVYKTDKFGIATHEKRPSIDILDAKALINTGEVDYTIDKLRKRRGTTSLYIGDERDKGFQSMTVLGYIKQVRISVENPQKTEFPISIIGVA